MIILYNHKMPKRSTKTKRGLKNRSMKKPCCEKTHRALHDGFEHVFTNLGWMLLANSHGRTDKIIAYKNSLQHLKHNIEERVKYMKDVDRKEDLAILHRDLMILIDHVKKDFD
jgi:hypothetical protein